MTNSDLATVIAEERRIMNTWASDYDAAALSNAYVYRIERAQFADWVTTTSIEAGGEPETAAVLDAGCGTGDVIELLSRRGFADLTGLDLAEGMLTEARKRNLPGARWVQGTIEDPPFDEATFDVVLACFTLHHLLDPGAFFRLVERTLRPGGWFFVLDFNGEDPRQPSLERKAAHFVGGFVRAGFALKNRRVLAAQPTLPRLFNPAHRRRTFDEIVTAIERPEEYELVHEARGVLLPALTLVLVEESSFDRGLARSVSAIDRRLAARTGGIFQWIGGRRRLRTA